MFMPTRAARVRVKVEKREGEADTPLFSVSGGPEMRAEGRNLRRKGSPPFPLRPFLLFSPTRCSTTNSLCCARRRGLFVTHPG